ncbi:HlyD family secretion protein [Shivajiella indica]|uniref:HlyD family secretion protein n=1 Tax=Shivajiella indica TaxID=872115 RepID=A0ABW5B5Z9_9BACT
MIFPAAVIKQTTEYYQSKITVTSQSIYLLLLMILISGFIVLPLVEIDVTVQARGTFQSSLQRNAILSSSGGRLQELMIKENQKVKKGEVLAVIRSESVNLEISGHEERLQLLHDFISDLYKLIQLNFDQEELEFPILRTKFYQAGFFEFHTAYNNQQALVQKQDRDFNRAKILYEAKSIAFAEFDEAEIQYKQSIANFDLLKKRKKAEWEQELVTYQREKLNLSNQIEILQEQLDQFTIIAGVSGTVINVPNLNVGDFIFANQKLGEISPDSSLLAVTYLSPADIAFIEKGQVVNFQVDAYNYNQWGLAYGKVLEIADDLTLISENEAGFLVTCILDSPILMLKTGYEGEIKKGMTFNSRFVIARRTLFQLLYDKVDDWLNPSRS